MPGLLKEKKKLFNKEPVMPERPKSVEVREAENGFVVHCHGPEEYGGDKPKVATTLAGAIKLLKDHFGTSEDTAEKDDE